MSQAAHRAWKRLPLAGLELSVLTLCGLLLLFLFYSSVRRCLRAGYFFLE